MTKRTVALLGGTAMWLAGTAANAQELNALVWCDHTDDALIKPFEEEFGVTVNVREYEGTGAALALLEQSRPGDWDVLVIDGIDVFRAVESRSEEHTSELQSPVPISYAVFCLKKKKNLYLHLSLLKHTT